MESGMKILGLGQVSACGAGSEALRAALEGKRPEPQWIAIGPSEEVPRVPVMKADATGIDEMVPARSVRRLDDFAKNSIFAAALAVRDSGVEMPPPERIAVVTGTGYASLNTSFSLLDDIIFEGDEAGSPFKFTTAVNNASASSVATFLNARGPCLSVLGFQDVMLNVLRVAGQWLAEHRADVVVAGAGDEFHPMVGYGLSHLGGWAADGRMRPLDFSRLSYVPGESFTAFVLVRGDSPLRGRAVVEHVAGIAELDSDHPQLARVPLVVAADGRSETAATYRRIVEAAPAVVAYTHLWGGNPSAESMSLAAAVLGVERGCLFPMTPADHKPRGAAAADGILLAKGTVACVTANPDRSGSVISLGPDRA